MSALNEAPGLGEAELHDELFSLVSVRTREILERRRGSFVRNRGWLVRRLLATADVVGLLAGMLLAEWIVTTTTEAGAFSAGVEIAALIATLPGWIVVAKLYGLYDRDEERTDHSTADDFVAVFNMITVCTWLFWALSRITHWFYPTPPKLIIFWAAAVAFVTAGRAVARSVARRNVAYLQNTVIVGAGDVGKLVARKLTQHPEYGLNLVGFVDSVPMGRRDELGLFPILGALDRLPAIVHVFDIERVIVAFSKEPDEVTLALIRSLRESNIQIDVVPRLYELVGPSVGLHTIEGLALIGLPPAKMSRSSRALKRSLDIIGALVGLAFTWPLFAYAAWRIKRESPGPVLFKQPRLGMDKREFTALKFRTMRTDTDDAPHREYVRRAMDSSVRPNGNGLYKLDRDDAVTPVGRWLRKTSLDELPQLINVLRGDMSLVGPRPCIPYEMESFEPHHFDRFLVPAGMTGLWQVTARARSTFGEALDLDVAYANGWSLKLDLMILFKTPLQLVRPRWTA